MVGGTYLHRRERHSQPYKVKPVISLPSLNYLKALATLIFTREQSHSQEHTRPFGQITPQQTSQYTNNILPRHP